MRQLFKSTWGGRTAMLGSLINLVFIGGLVYELFLSPVPDEEVLQEENIDIDEYAKTSITNIAMCLIGLFLINVVTIINYFI